MPSIGFSERFGSGAQDNSNSKTVTVTVTALVTVSLESTFSFNQPGGFFVWFISLCESARQ